MSGISAWIMSIAGISVISVLVDLMMPNGQTKKYIKGVFAFIIVFIIISPIPALINKEINIDDIFQEEIELQDEYIYQINRDRLDSFEDLIVKDLEKKGISGVDLNINANIFTSDMKINAIFVDLSQVVINENMSHIDINELVKSSILKYITIEEDNIIFDSNED
ncbi:MAG: stage III sporulation protein AF [Clostridia bacterium]|nr:stage III sporulation protein AF [Clostridia bacterium]